MNTALTQYSDALAETVARVAAGTVVVDGRARTSSSGVLWAPGIVVTADHTVQHDDVRVRLPDGTDAKATLAGRDRATDLAVLRIESNRPHAAFAEAGALKAGNIALAVGRNDRGVLATMGIVSTVAGPWRTWRGGIIDTFVRLDLSLYSGSSGGAAAGIDGAVFGIATAGLSRSSAIAIPKSTVDHVVAEVLRSGHVARGYLGVGLQPVPLPAHLKSRLNVEQNGGVMILTVEPGGPAEAGGLLIGDVVLQLDGRAVTDTDDMQSALATAAVGSTIRVAVVRGGAGLELNITVGERPGKD